MDDLELQPLRIIQLVLRQPLGPVGDEVRVLHLPQRLERGGHQVLVRRVLRVRLARVHHDPSSAFLAEGGTAGPRELERRDLSFVQLRQRQLADPHADSRLSCGEHQHKQHCERTQGDERSSLHGSSSAPLQTVTVARRASRIRQRTSPKAASTKGIPKALPNLTALRVVALSSCWSGASARPRVRIARSAGSNSSQSATFKSSAWFGRPMKSSHSAAEPPATMIRGSPLLSPTRGVPLEVLVCASAAKWLFSFPLTCTMSGCGPLGVTVSERQSRRGSMW